MSRAVVCMKRCACTPSEAILAEIEQRSSEDSSLFSPEVGSKLISYSHVHLYEISEARRPALLILFLRSSLSSSKRDGAPLIPYDMGANLVNIEDGIFSFDTIFFGGKSCRQDGQSKNLFETSQLSARTTRTHFLATNHEPFRPSCSCKLTTSHHDWQDL